MTRNTWNTFVEARYPALVKAASRVVGAASAAGAVQDALQRAVTSSDYLKCRTDPFAWVISAVTLARASGRGAKAPRDAGALAREQRASPAPKAARVRLHTPVSGGFAGIALRRTERQAAARLALDISNGKEIEAQRIFDADTAALLARVRAGRKPRLG